MIFIIAIIFTILCSVLYKKTKDNYNKEILSEMGMLGCITGIVISFIMICVIIGMNVGVDAQIEEMNIERDMLVYQYENNFYENDNDVGKWELIKEIQEWNKDLVYLQNIQDNFWVGIFVPNIYDQFDLIPLENTRGEQE